MIAVDSSAMNYSSREASKQHQGPPKLGISRDSVEEGAGGNYHRNDILLGRGKFCQHHPGNVRLRNLMATYEQEYVEGTRRDKTIVSAKVVATIKDIGKLEGGGRFLKYNTKTKQWEEIPDSVARQRVGHSIRDTLRRKAFLEQNEGKDSSTKTTRKYNKKNEDSDYPNLATAMKDRIRAAGVMGVGAGGDPAAAPGLIPPKKKLKTSHDTEHDDSSSSSEEEDQLANALLSLKGASGEKSNKKKGKKSKGSSSSASSRKQKGPSAQAAQDQTRKASATVPGSSADQQTFVPPQQTDLQAFNTAMAQANLSPFQRELLLLEHRILQEQQSQVHRNAAVAHSFHGMPSGLASFNNQAAFAAAARAHHQQQQQFNQHQQQQQQHGGAPGFPPGFLNNYPPTEMSVEQARHFSELRQRALSLPQAARSAGAAVPPGAAGGQQQHQQHQQQGHQALDYRSLPPELLRNPSVFVTFMGGAPR